MCSDTSDSESLRCFRKFRALMVGFLDRLLGVCMFSNLVEGSCLFLNFEHCFELDSQMNAAVVYLNETIQMKRHDRHCRSLQ